MGHLIWSLLYNMIMSLNHSNLRIFLIDIDLGLILFQRVGFKGSPEPI